MLSGSFTSSIRAISRSVVIFTLGLLMILGAAHRLVSAPGRPAASDGAVSVSSEPSAAAFFLDNKFVGQTPLEVPATAGDHRVRLVKDGYIENGRILTVVAGKTEALRVRLTPRAASPSIQSGLKIVVLEGEEGVNIIQQKTAVSSVVEVRDNNNLPVAGAIVTFAILAGTRGDAVLANGLKEVTLATNAAGRAAAAVSPVTGGPIQLQVSAAYQGQTAVTTITQTNFTTAAEAAQAAKGSAASSGGGAGGGLSGAAIGGIAAAGAAGVAVVAKTATGNKTPPTPTCSFSVTPTSFQGTGSGTVNVSVSPANCTSPAWSAVSNAAFITFTGGASGSGSGSVTFDAAPGPQGGAARTGTITIAGQTVTITQPPPCAFTVSPTTINAPAAASTATVTITASPAGCTPNTWTAQPSGPIGTVSPTSGSGNGVVTININANVASQARSGSLIVAGQPVTINQSPAAAQCNAQQVQGGDVPETRTIELGRRSGVFVFQYDTQNIADRMILSYEGRTLFDTGCIGTGGLRSQSISYSGNATTVTVQVTPNCQGGSNTAWSFSVFCPQ